MSGTKIFQKHRALGFVSNQIPATLRYLKKRKENVIVTCVGRSFHVYACNSFRLLTTSGFHPDNINCLSSDNFYIYSSCKNLIYTWRFGNEIKYVLRGHEHDIHLLLPFGKHLISVDESSTVKIWEVQTGIEYLEIPFQNEQFKITTLVHPPTYINKILIGSEQGKMQLWNIKEAKVIYNFKQFDSSITVMESTPALDVIAIGFSSGKITLLNIKFEEVIMEFYQDWGSVTGIAFRTDGFQIMATSSTNGQIVFWDLDEKKISSQLKAHSNTITTLKCLADEPLLITTSPDNTLKMWIFDLPDGGARLLRIREGHAAPPNFIRFHGLNGSNIISSSEDSSMRVFNVVSEMLNKNFGRASYNRKVSRQKNRFEEDSLIMPHVTKFTTELTREKEWDNIAAIHSGIPIATTWSFYKTKMGDIKLKPTGIRNEKVSGVFEATAITLTHCGNFVVIGYSNGYVLRYNIQSGIHRATYGNPAHKKASIRGVATDALNQFVITGGSDGIVKFWNFKPTDNGTEPISTVKLESGIVLFLLHRESSLLCVALEDYKTLVLDCETRVIVRSFKSHKGLVTDMCVSPDGRWLITSGMDCTIKVWDIPSSYLIDHFRVESPCTSLTISPTGQYLATTHANDLGIYLWVNKSIYSHVSLRSINPESEAPLIDLPTTCIFEHGELLNKAVEKLTLDEGEELELKYETPIQLDSDLITLSDQSTIKWQGLLDLDIIKKRNKPKQPLKKPKQAPFFLPTVAGPEVKFDLTEAIQEQESLKIQTNSIIDNTTTLGKILKESCQENEYKKCLEYLKSIGPSMVDYEIKSLSPHGAGSIELIEIFMKFLIDLFETNLYFELAQSYLGVLLKSHSEHIYKSKKLCKYIDELIESQNQGWKKLENELMYGIGVANTLKNYVI